LIESAGVTHVEKLETRSLSMNVKKTVLVLIDQQKTSLADQPHSVMITCNRTDSNVEL